MSEAYWILIRVTACALAVMGLLITSIVAYLWWENR